MAAAAAILAPVVSFSSPVADEPAEASSLPAPTSLLVAGWHAALRRGRPAQAAGYRRLVEALDEAEPTWEDAEWQ